MIAAKYKLVPVEPTEEMVAAGVSRRMAEFCWRSTTHETREICRAAIAAAPSPTFAKTSDAANESLRSENERLRAQLRFGWECAGISPDSGVALDKPHRFGSFIRERIVKLEAALRRIADTDTDDIGWFHDVANNALADE